MIEQYLVSDKNSLLNYPLKPTIAIIKVTDGISEDIKNDVFNLQLDIRYLFIEIRRF